MSQCDQHIVSSARLGLAPKTLNLEGAQPSALHIMGLWQMPALLIIILVLLPCPEVTLWLLIWLLLSISGIHSCNILPI